MSVQNRQVHLEVGVGVRDGEGGVPHLQRLYGGCVPLTGDDLCWCLRLFRPLWGPRRSSDNLWGITYQKKSDYSQINMVQIQLIFQ